MASTIEEVQSGHTQWGGMLSGLTHYARAHPKEDVVPALMMWLFALADNDRGACSVSLASLAPVLGRDVQTITEAYRALERDGCFITEFHGDQRLIVPVIDRRMEGVEPNALLEVLEVELEG